MQDSIIFKEELPDIQKYWDLFQTTAWNEEYHFSPEELQTAIRNSWYFISVYDIENLVGFGRILADGIHHALIVDLIIHPEYQGKGLGSKLLGRLIRKCRDHNIRDVQLFAARDKYQFYERSGFRRRPDNAPGMQLLQTFEADTNH